MGSFDRIRFVPVFESDNPKDLEQALELECAQGHKQSRMDTKDLGEHHNTFVFYGAQLYEPIGETVGPFHLHAIGSPLLSQGTAQNYRPLAHSGEITVYNQCGLCDPIVFANRQADISAAYPWLEYVLVLEQGLWVETRPVTVDSREATAAEWRGYGFRVFDDDDPFAVHYRKKHDRKTRP